MDKPVLIRATGVDDLAAVVALLEKLDLPVEGLSTAAHVWVAEIGGVIVGCAALETDGSYGLLRSVGVVRDRQHAGIGALLVETVHARASELSLQSTYLLTTTAESYFPRFGYTPTSYEELPTIVTTSPEFSDCASSGATVMVRTTTN